MMTTVRAVVKDGRITLLEPLQIAEGTELLVTVLDDEDRAFWAAVTDHAFAKIWDNPEDDVYGELLED
jgi:hypothetical protein